MAELKKILKKINGKETLSQYCYARVMGTLVFSTMVNGTSRKGLEITRLAIYNKIVRRLRKKNKKLTAEFTANYQDIYGTKREDSDKVWVLWLQGMEEAPEIVKVCYNSLKRELKDKDIILLTENNYREYVTFPEHIQNKIDSGVITRTHMSDLLRLELLIKYGGTWIDATVYCSGGNIPDYMLNSDLFLFQNLKPGSDGQTSLISSWYMRARTNSPILILTRELLYNYWKKHNRMVDYFLLHDFFQLAIETFPEEWDNVIPVSNSAPHIILLRLFDKKDDALIQAVFEQTCFHKLSYKFDADKIQMENTNYKYIINR